MRFHRVVLVASALWVGAGAVAFAQDAQHAPQPPAAVDPGGYGVRARDLQFRVEELGSDIARARRALAVLATEVFEAADGAVVSIVHDNGMGPLYRLVRAQYAIDGVPVFARADPTGALDERERFDVYRGAIAPGAHVLSVRLDYVGQGGFAFRYLEGYHFTLSAGHDFTAPSGRTLHLRVRAFPRGDATTSYIDRPALGFAESIQSR